MGRWKTELENDPTVTMATALVPDKPVGLFVSLL